MNWFNPLYTSFYVSTVVMLALAGLLIWLDPGRATNRAFAAFLFLRAGANHMGILRRSAETIAEAQFFHTMGFYFVLAMVPVLIYFISIYPKPRGAFGRSRFAGWVTVGLSLAICVPYLLDHTLYASIAAGRAEVYALNIGSFIQYTDFGPLALLQGFQGVLTGIVALLLAFDQARMSPTERNLSHFLVFAGFCLNALFDGVSQTAFLVETIQQGQYPWLPFGWAPAILPPLSLPLALTAVGVIVWHRTRSTETEFRRESTRFLIAAALALASAVASALMTTGFFGDPRAALLLGLWRLSLPALATYALLRYSLFGLDLKIRKGIGSSAVAAVFAAAYFLASETVEGLVSDAQGPAFGLAAAAMLTIIIKPIKKFGDLIAQKAMPNAKPIEALLDDDRLKLYAEHVVLAAEDGGINDKERRLLDNLRARLDIPEEQAHRIERDPSSLLG